MRLCTRQWLGHTPASSQGLFSSHAPCRTLSQVSVHNARRHAHAALVHARRRAPTQRRRCAARRRWNGLTALVHHVVSARLSAIGLAQVVRLTLLKRFLADVHEWEQSPEIALAPYLPSPTPPAPEYLQCPLDSTPRIVPSCLPFTSPHHAPNPFASPF
jgi:hypothetical protein